MPLSSLVLRLSCLCLLLLASGLPALADGDGRPLDQAFRGRIAAFDGKTITLVYDFSKKEQLADWTEGVPFPIDKEPGQSIRWFDNQLEIQGNTGVRHIARWTGDVEISFTVTPDGEKDIGAFLVPVPEEPDIATFTLCESYFHGWDGDPGGKHSIIKFGKQWRESGSTSDYTGFRYVARRPPADPIVPGRKIRFTYGVHRGKLFLQLADFELKGKDLGKRLKVLTPGFYTVGARALFDEVQIRGRLDKAWLREKGFELRVIGPVVPVGVDGETASLVAAYAAGEVAASKVAAVLTDDAKADEAREAAAAALEAGPKKAVSAMLDLLYSGDVEVRAFGIRVVKSLLGKDYGFKPKGKEATRSAAIRKLTQDLRDNPDLLED